MEQTALGCAVVAALPWNRRRWVVRWGPRRGGTDGAGLCGGGRAAVEQTALGCAVVAAPPWNRRRWVVRWGARRGGTDGAGLCGGEGEQGIRGLIEWVWRGPPVTDRLGAMDGGGEL